MKSFRLFFYVSLFLSAVFLISCEDEPLDVGLSDGLPDAEWNVTFKVDGVNKELFGAANYVENMFPGVSPDTINGWQITAMGLVETEEAGEYEESGEALGIQLFPAELSTGEFDLQEEDTAFENFTLSFSKLTADRQDMKGYFSTSGQVKITEINEGNKTLSGTFKATLKEVRIDSEEPEIIEITNGRLNHVPYFVDEDWE